MEKLNCRAKYTALVFFALLLLISGAALWFTVFFALIEYLCETQINERIVIKRKTSGSIYGNSIIENL